MEAFGRSYQGDRQHGRMDGNGRFYFENGNYYDGQFVDGQFHGKGTLYFPKYGYYVGTWERGRVIEGNYFFNDGLNFELENWAYCKNDDRRFFSETQNGLKPAGASQMHNLHPPPKIPAGMFDIANGYYDPDSGKVYTYSGAELRIADEKERAFIMKYCRKDMSRGKD